MRKNDKTVYYLDMTAEEIHEHYEQMTLMEAYQKKRITLRSILASWWLYIITNALCILMCSIVIIAAGLILIDCFAATQAMISVLEMVQKWPAVFAGAGAILLAGLICLVTVSTMSKEEMLIEKEVAYSV